MRLAATLAALCASVPLAAQVEPQPLAGDRRIQAVDYDPDQVIVIQAAQGYQVTLQFGSDERIENVAVGDSAAWQVNANQRGDLLFVKPVQAGVSTNLTVATDVRLYAFELSPLDGAYSDMPFMVRFRYPPAPETESEQPEGPGELIGHYRLGGARALRPSRIADDGARTYIEWPESSALPAVYVLDDQGREVLANGHMRDGVYVIDGVAPRLRFRIDRDVARAVRIEQRGARR